MAETPGDLLARAEQLIEIGRHGDAIPLLTKARGMDVNDYTIPCMTALAFYGLGEYKNGIRYAEEAIQIEPEAEWGHRLRSVCLSSIGGHREAVKSAREAVRLHPYEPATHLTLSNALLEAGKPDKAREAAEPLLELDPYSHDTHYTLGNIHLAKGDNRLAETSFREALKVKPDSADARNNLGVALLRRDVNSTSSMFGLRTNSIITPQDATEDHFREALKLDPTNETAAENLRNQYSYIVAIIPIFAYIPFMMMAFVVIPLGTLISVGITIYWSVRACIEVKRKREELSPEMQAFLTQGSMFGEKGLLQVFADTLWDSFYKTWKPHALALAALVVNLYSLSSGSSALRLASVITMVICIYWLASESRKV